MNLTADSSIDIPGGVPKLHGTYFDSLECDLGGNVQKRRRLFKRDFFLGVWLTMGFLIATQYNACGPVAFNQSTESKLVDLKASAVVLINRDAQFTKSELVEVNLDAHQADEVYVTNDSTCNSGGVWEPMLATRSWTLAVKNQKANVYAKFRSVAEGISTGCLSDDILHDDIPPEVVLSQPLMITNVPTPIVTFVAGDTGSGLEKMVCEWPGKAPEACSFSTSNGNVAEGRYLIKINAADKATNVSVPVIQDLIVDRTPPNIIFLSTPSIISNNPKADYAFNVTDDRSGVKSVECAYDSKANYAPCTSPQTANLAEGAHKFFIRAFDLAGNMSEASHDFAIDLSAPTVQITKSPSDFTKSSTADFEFIGKDGNDPITQFDCRVDGAAYASCSSPKTYANLSDGLHTFDVLGYDKVGNKSAPASRSWYIDTKPPVITFVLTPDALGNNPAAVFKYSITDVGTGVASSECSLDGAAYASCAMDMMTYPTLADGSHSFKVRATDKAGNVGESAPQTFVIDLKPPTIRLTDVPPAFSNLKDFNFKFEANDDRGIQRVECRIDAGPYVVCDSVTAHMVRDLIEGSHRFSVKAIDKAGNMSPEVYYEWIVDLTPPVVAYFQLPPASALTSSVITLGFTVADPISGVKSLECRIDGSLTACKSGDLKTLMDLAQGMHVFDVIAFDNAGNKVVDSKSISISSPMLKTQLVDVTGNNKVDILMIIDNSGSMAAEQTNMAARFSNFLDKIKALDWQIGIVSTDMTDINGTSAKKGGRLIQLAGMPGQYILNSGMLQTTAQSVFGQTVQMGSDGSGAELGFQAAIKAIDRAFDPTQPVNAPHGQLFRQDAALAMVVVSDAYDDSGTRPEDVLGKVTQRWGGNKPFVFHSIVVPESQYTDPSRSSVFAADPCKNYRESVKFDGREYHRLSTMTGGVKGTVCSEDFSTQLADMGKVTADLVNSVTLNCQPIDYNKDGKIDAGDVTVVTSNGAPIVDFTVQGTKLTFTIALPIGQNEIKYYCAQ